MIKTLVCLAASMTAGTVVLSWFEPSVRIPSRLQAADTSFPVELVDYSDSSPSSGWKAIRLHYVAEARTGRGSISLRAERPGLDPSTITPSGTPSASGSSASGPSATSEKVRAFHFLIDENGTTHRGPLWKAQQAISPGDSAITIAVIGREIGRAIPARQWNALQHLIHDLGRSWTISPDQVMLDAASDPTKCPDCPRPIHDLYDRLRSAGYL